jgi:hypothetical protein
MRRHSWASGHLLMICASNGTGTFVLESRVEVHGMPPSLDVDGSSNRTEVIGVHAKYRKATVMKPKTRGRIRRDRAGVMSILSPFS